MGTMGERKAVSEDYVAREMNYDLCVTTCGGKQLITILKIVGREEKCEKHVE